MCCWTRKRSEIGLNNNVFSFPPPEFQQTVYRIQTSMNVRPTDVVVLARDFYINDGCLGTEGSRLSGK